MNIHPAAGIFPLLEGADFDALCADVRENGLLNPIVLFNGDVLDGRNRYRACEAEGVEPRYVSPKISNPVAFVWSANVTRRHLTPGQLACAAVKADAMGRQRGVETSQQGQAYPPRSVDRILTPLSP